MRRRTGVHLSAARAGGRGAPGTHEVGAPRPRAGPPRVRRNGYGKPRKLALSNGTITRAVPASSGLEKRFESRVLPLLKGALLSATSIAWLKAQWQIASQEWRSRSLADLDIVHCWADALYVKGGTEDAHCAMSRTRGLKVPQLVIAGDLAGTGGDLAAGEGAALESQDGQRARPGAAEATGGRSPARARHDVCRDVQGMRARESDSSSSSADRRRRPSTRCYGTGSAWSRFSSFRQIWIDLPPANVIESPIASERLRTTAAKRCDRVVNASAPIWKLLRVAERMFQRLNAPHLLAAVAPGATYLDGAAVLTLRGPPPDTIYTPMTRPPIRSVDQEGRASRSSILQCKRSPFRSGAAIIRLHLPHALVLGAALLPGCEGNADHSLLHPAADAFVHPFPAESQLALAVHSSELPAFSPPSQVAPPVLSYRVGALDGASDLVFGRIEGAVSDRHGRLHVLDSYAASVIVMDERARLSHQYGKRGSGPGEISNPRGLTVGGEGEILVLDGNGHIHVFEIGLDSVRFSHRIRFAGDLFDACAMRGRLFVHGMRPGSSNAIHAYSLDGDALHSFGTVYGSSNPIIQYQLSKGRITCIGRLNVVLLAPAVLPELRAYSATGDLLWWTEITGFRPLTIAEGSKGSSRIAFAEDGHNLTVALVGSPDDRLAILQVAHVRGTRKATQIQTFVLDLDTRIGIFLGSSWPRFIYWTDQRIVAVADDPYPELLVYDWLPSFQPTLLHKP
jgi:hypothetical protein